MGKQRYSKYSWVEPTVEQISGHNEDITMFLRVNEPADGGCRWRTSEEDHWVAHFASWLLDQSRQIRPKLQFHQVFEKPSHRSEAKDQGGYDLSFGPYDNDLFRIRTMHKVMKGKWCDAYWRWCATKDDMRHVSSLVNTDFAEAFLVINVFYCLHDWRRMGMKCEDPKNVHQGFTIPAFESPLRTIVVKLSGSKKLLSGGDPEISVTCSGLQQEVKSADEWQNTVTSEGFIKAFADDEPLEIVPLESLLIRIKEAWSPKGYWGQSALE